MCIAHTQHHHHQNNIFSFVSLFLFMKEMDKTEKFAAKNNFIYISHRWLFWRQNNFEAEKKKTGVEIYEIFQECF